MRTTQGTTLGSLRSADTFLTDNADALPSVVTTGARKELGDLIADVEAHASDQSGHALAAQSATRKQRMLRTALLRDHMAPISRIARAALPTTSETEPLKMPDTQATAARLASAAEGMGKAALPYADIFVAAGLPTDFVPQLNAAADAMIGAVNDRAQHRGKVGGATEGLKTKLSRGRHLVKVLDAFVQSAAKDNPVLLANWNIVKRVQLTGGRHSTTKPLTPTPTPTQTSAAPPATTESR